MEPAAMLLPQSGRGSTFVLLLWMLLIPVMPAARAQEGADLPNPFDFLPVEGSNETRPPLLSELSEVGEGEVGAAEVGPPRVEANSAESGGPGIAEIAEDPAAEESLAEESPAVEPPVDGPAIDRPAIEAPIEPAKPAVDEVLEEEFEKAYIIEVEGPIFGRFHWFLNQRLDRAQELGADLVLVRITSPGGDLEQSLQLARRLRDIDWATTIAYISDEAISGGAIIALGCDRIYMKDGALIGDAGPIRMGLDGQFQHAEEKVVSFLVSAVRELAKAQGRPPGVAEAMVDRSVVLYMAVDRQTGQPTVLTEAETKADGADQRYQIGAVVAESGNNRFLTVGADRAKDLLLSEGVFADERALLNQLNVQQIERTSMTWIDRTVYLLNRPWLTVLLLIVGLVGLYFELAAPGLSVAGLLSMLCFGIFFWSHALGGTSGWLEVLLFLLGVVCLVCEIFVLPGFGVFGLTGLGLVAVSLVMASQDFIIPSDRQQWGELQYNATLVLGVLMGVILLGFLQVVLLDSIPGLNRFRLATPDTVAQPSEGRSISLAAANAVGEQSISVGEQGTADSDLRPSGKVMLGGRLVDVVTEGDYVDAGSPVEIIRVEGNRVTVRRVVG